MKIKNKIILIFFVLLAFFVAHADTPQTLVVFGATGDLTKKKLVPALIELKRSNNLPKDFLFVGVGRRPYTHEQFFEHLTSPMSKENEEIWKGLKDNIVYVSGDFEEKETYEKLSQILPKTGDSIFYLATPYSSFISITDKLYNHHLLEDRKKSRLLIEKPLGQDFSSASDLQNHLLTHFDPEQIYLVDHYLGKKMVRNLLALRLNNPLLETLLNKNYIDRVEITISEDIGVGTRGAFWEETGLLRDIIQSHAMQLLSIVAMDTPQESSIHAEKVKALNALRPFPTSAFDQFIVRGQYGEGILHGDKIVSYREEKGVNKNSPIETYVAAKMFVDTPRFKDVPFIVKSGKRLSSRFAEIKVIFKPKELSLMPQEMIIRIQPKEEIVLNFIDTNGSYSLVLNESDSKMLDAYAEILYESLQQDHTHFSSFEENLLTWQIFTPVLNYWKENIPENFPNYSAGSNGPDISQLYKE